MATQSTALARPIAAPSVGLLLPAFTLWWREIVRFYRQKTRVVGVLASPLVFWLVIGSGFGTSFRSGGGPSQQHYLDYFYPGALIMTVLFTSIFTMMSVIDDRKEGFLLSVLVAPVPRSAIVLGKVLGGTTLSAIQGMIFLIFAPFTGVHLNVVQVLLVAVVVLLVSFALTALGLRHRVAHGFFAGLPRHCQSVSDSLVAVVWLAVSAWRRFALDSRADALESAHLRGGGAARSALSRCCVCVSAFVRHCDPDSVLSGHVRPRFADGQSPHQILYNMRPAA
jgi:ABC-type transport system involved in cytochrome c biogenesis permease component